MTNARWPAMLVAALAACQSDHRSASSRLTGQTAAVATADGRAAAADSARAMVQAFYDWYVALGEGPASATRYDSVLATQGTRFAPPLLTAFREDVAAQRRDTLGEIVSFSGEADPFLNSQDPCSRYVARDVTPLAAGFAVAVFGNCGKAPARAPAVVAEVERGPQGWRFTNFRNVVEPKFDLLSELRRSSAGRQQSPDTAAARRP